MRRLPCTSVLGGDDASAYEGIAGHVRGQAKVVEVGLFPLTRFPPRPSWRYNFAGADEGICVIMPLPSRAVKRLRIASAAFAVIGWIFTMCSVSVWFWPNIPTQPRPETGHVFPMNMHGTPVYWTRTEVGVHNWLGWPGISLFFVGVLLNKRVDALKKRSELESIRRQFDGGDR